MSVKCNYCGDNAELVTGEVIYPHRPDLSTLVFWRCEPCDAYVGCHKRSKNTPLGRLANAELRHFKTNAHRYFDVIWKRGYRSRTGAYAWLANQLGIKPSECHIGMFDVETCKEVARLSREYLATKGK